MIMKEEFLSFRRARGLNSSTGNAWRLFALHWRAYLRFLWPHALIAGMGAGLSWAMLYAMLAEHFIPMYLLVRSGGAVADMWALCAPDGGSWLLLAAAVVATFVAVNMFLGALAVQMRFAEAQEELPATGAFAFWQNIRQAALRSALVTLPFVLTGLLFTALCLWICFRFSLWWALAFLPLYIYIGIGGLRMWLAYVAGPAAWLRSLRMALVSGWGRVGGCFLQLLITSLPVCFFSVAFALPSCFLLAAGCLDSASLLMDDVSSLPASVPWLYGLFAALGSCLSLLGVSVQLWAFRFFLGGEARD